MSDRHTDHIAQLDAYSHRLSRLEVLVARLQSEVFDNDPEYPESLQAVTNFLADEISDTKAQQAQLVDAELQRSAGGKP